MTHRPRDMFLSLAAILVPILVIMWLFTQRTETPVRPVDWAPVAAQAKAEAPYPVVVPTSLGGDWTPTRATWVKAGNPDANGRVADGSTWTMGWLTPGRVYVELAQRDTAPDALVAQRARDARRDGDRVVEGATWEQYRTDDDRTRALLRRESGAATIVAGDLSYDDLAAFAATLR